MFRALLWHLAAVYLLTPVSANILDNMIQNTVNPLNTVTPVVGSLTQTVVGTVNNTVQEAVSGFNGTLSQAVSFTQAIQNIISNLAEDTGSVLNQTLVDALEGNLLKAVTSGAVTLETIGALYDTVSDLREETQTLVVTAISDQCATLKTVMRLIAETLCRNGTEPDVSQLTLDYITWDTFQSYNLSTAAEEIPKASWFTPDQPFVVYAHGFTDNPNDTEARNVTEALLDLGLANVLAIDSSSLIGSYYLQSSTNVQHVGEALGRFLYALTQAGVDPSSIYLVGHSLGSHICGHAGKTYTFLSGSKVSRITGLDPAGPCFTNLESSMRLSSTDADFVDVILTNAGVFGLDEEIGHVNFSPNGGSSQPGCVTILCNHYRSTYLFAESVLSPQSFPAVACDTWPDFRKEECNYSDIRFLGYGSSNVSRGEYFLETAASSPFGLGEDGTTYSG